MVAAVSPMSDSGSCNAISYGMDTLPTSSRCCHSDSRTKMRSRGLVRCLQSARARTASRFGTTPGWSSAPPAAVSTSLISCAVKSRVTTSSHGPCLPARGDQAAFLARLCHPQNDVAIALARPAERPKRVDQVMIEPDPHLPVRPDGPGRTVRQGRSYGLERGRGDCDCDHRRKRANGRAVPERCRMFRRRQGAKAGPRFLCCRVSSFRGWTRSVNAPTPNCLDFGWRCRPPQESGSLARACGDGDLSPQHPRAAGGL